VAAAVLLAAALSACDDSAATNPGGSAAAAAQLLGSGPQGFTLNAAASGPLSLAAARVATLADPDTLGTALGRNGFDAGHATVWQHGTDYETDMVLRFHTSEQALAVLDVEHQAMRSGTGVFASAVESIPNSWAYTMFGATRSGGRQVFCQGVWFAVDADLYGVTTCGATPAGESAAVARAGQQYQRALSLAGRLPLPAAPSPTP
jgi:hypothetical protein